MSLMWTLKTETPSGVAQPASSLVGPTGRRVKSWKRITPLTALFSTLVGILILIGWSADVPLLRSLLPGFPAVPPATALALVLLGVSISLIGDHRNSGLMRSLGWWCAIAVTVLGLLTLAEYATRSNSGLHHLLVPDRTSFSAADFSDRPSPHTAIVITLLGVALLAFPRLEGPRFRLVQLIAIVAGLLSLMAMVVRFHRTLFYQDTAPTGMSLAAAFSCLALSFGILCSRPDQAIMRVISGEGAGGILARRLLPALLLLPLLVGWLRLLGEQSGLYDAPFGVSLMILLSITLSVGLILWTAEQLQDLDEKRMEASEALKVANAGLEDSVRERTAELDSQREWLEITLGSIGDGVIATDVAGKVSFMNLAAEEMTGWTQSEAIGSELDRVLVLADAETRKPVDSPLAKLLPEGAAAGLGSDVVLVNRDGTVRPIDLGCAPIQDKEGDLQGAVLTFRDVSERKLHEQEQHTVMSSLRCLLWYCDVSRVGPNDMRWELNPINEEAAQKLMPITIAPGESYISAMQRCYLKGERERMDAYAKEMVERGRSYAQDFRCRQADGEIRWLHEDVSVETIAPGRWRVVGVTTDITDRKRLEDQLLQAQKLESVGRLAGGVAHDFNNLLTVILGYGELTEREGTLEGRSQEYLSTMMHAARRAANLTQQLLMFARRQMIAPQVVDLNDITLNLTALLRRLIGEHIELVVLPKEGLHYVKVDPTQFEQILVNLVVNARDAMQKGGKISIETRNVVLDEEYAERHEGVAPGEYVMVAVSDTGSGMDEAVRLHIFEPFFTTKEKGRGTGLGLATVYGIVKQSGGHIWLYSEAGVGTTFRIYLPRSTEEATVQLPAASAEPFNGSETVLLVEDEPSVRAMAVQALRGQGYTVLEAMNGEEALRLIKGREQEIALLITDVVMPQMSGKDLADRLQAIHPGIRTLYASGYTENTVLHHGVLEAGVNFLSKPFTPTLLIRKVREILDA
jgi:two-component system, cell cycle sensor histidine kinase and response regulator CckA